MGAIIENQELINGLTALMSQNKAVAQPVSLVSRSGVFTFNDLPEDIQAKVNAITTNADLGGNTKLVRLLGGDLSDYDGDESKADMGFIRCLKENGFHADECDMVMRASPLMRGKWDEKRGDSTYGANTIAMVFSDGGNEQKAVSGTIATADAPRLNLSDGVLTFSKDLPPPRDFVIGDLILAAKSALFAGLGGVSKSQLMLQMAVCVVLGLPFMGRVTKAGVALLLFGEEDADELSRRVNAIAKVMRLTAEQLAQVQKRLRAFPMVGLDTRLTKPISGALESSGFAQGIIEAGKELEAECGLPIRLIGLDHLGLIHGGDFNAREDSVQTMLNVNHIAQETGAATIVLAHSPKASISKDAADAADVAGSAGFVDQSRGVFILRTMDDSEGKQYGLDPEQRKNYVALWNVKANYTRHGDVIWMKRDVVEGYEVSVLTPVELHEPIKVAKSSNFKLRGALFDLITEKPYLTRNALDGYAGKDGRLRASKQSIRTETTAMLAEGILSFRQPTDEECKRMGIRSATTGFLNIASTTPKSAKNG